jgi:hypothetical protein
MTATFCCLDFVFAVEATNRALQRIIEELYAPCRTKNVASIQYTVVEWHAPDGTTIVIFENDKCLRTTTDASYALAYVVWLVSQRVIAASSRKSLLLHAAAAERGQRAILLPGPSGAGKSTLVAGLVDAGFRYLTDDVCAIDPDSGQTRPYPKPISLAPHVVELFEHNGHGSPLVDDVRRYMTTGAFLTCAALGSMPGLESEVRLVVVPKHSPGLTTRLVAMSRAETLVLLAEQSFNFTALAPAALHVLADVLLRCECYGLTYDDLGEGVRLVSDLHAEVTRAPEVR